MKKRILSLAMILVMCLGLTTPVLADSTVIMNSPTNVSVGNEYTGLIDANGSLWMWGVNYTGQLGNGGVGNGQDGVGAYQTVPVKVLDNVISVSCGSDHTAAVKTDGSLWMWGNNYEGALGNSTRDYVLTPVKVMDNVVAVSCGYDYTAAIKTDGSLWMWGANSVGQLGKGSPGDSTSPIKVMEEVTAISCGKYGHVAAIKNDGSLWMWGDNSHGELGNSYVGNEKYDAGFGSAPLQDIPVKIMDDVTAVSCGYLHTAAIKNDGSLWTWGSNECGQLGNDREYNADNSPIASKYQTVPVKVMDSVTSVSCGSEYTAAVKNNGSLWIWGDNGSGQLGNGYVGTLEINQGYGNFPIQTVPIELMTGVASVSCGNGHTIIVKNDGSVWACGSNINGLLGIGNAYDGVNIYDHAMQTRPAKLSELTARMKLPTAFYDVNDNAYYTDAVIWAIDKNITKGTSANTFSPNKICTTGEILTFLWKAKNAPEPSISNPFSDVKESNYYYKAALWAYENGLVSGSIFEANNPCTRSMTVDFLWKLAGSPSASKSSFSDIPDNANYAEAVNWAVNEKITSGTNNNIFSPNSTCTRGQIVTFLYRDFVKN